MDWRAHPKQNEALTRKEFEILYGGARGGGKTDAGMAFLLYWKDNPLYRALVVRRNAKDLSDWTERAKIMYRPSGAVATGSPVTFRFPSGAIIKTGHLNTEDAYEQYQGHEYQKILNEELNLIPSEDSYLKLVSSCRSSVPGIDPQVFNTTNPGGAGHKWVKKRFGLQGIPREPVITVDKITGRSRVFIPSRVEDNPSLMENDPGYVKFLDGLPDGLREQWRLGSWDDFDVKGAIYSLQLNQARREGRVSRVPYEPELPVFTFWDLGVGDTMSIGFFQFVGRERRMIDYYQNNNYGLSHYLAIMKEKGYHYAPLYMPHDVNVKEMTTGRTRKESLESLGYTVEVVPKLSIEDGINAARIAWSTLWIDAEKCELFLDAIAQYKYDWDDNLLTFKKDPVHDWTSHPADMFRYFAVGSASLIGTTLDRPTQELMKSSEYGGDYGSADLLGHRGRFNYGE